MSKRVVIPDSVSLEALGDGGSALRDTLKKLEDIRYALDESTIVAFTDVRGDITYVNEAFCKISKYSEKELLGQNHRIVKSGYHPETFFKELWQTIASGKTWKGELKNKAKDGTIYWVDTTIVPFLDESGKPYQYVAIRHDITEQKRIEHEIRMLSESRESTLKKLEDIRYALDESTIVAFTDVRGDITYVNEAFCKISKYSEKELLGQNHRIVKSGYHPETFFKELWQTIASGKTWKGELKNKAKDGTIYWVDTTIVPFLDESGKPYQYVAIRHDITEQKRIEHEIRMLNQNLEERVQERTRELEKRNMALQETEKSREAFISALTHDMRTPLVGQKRVFEILEKNRKHFPEELAPMVQGLMKSNEGLLDLVNKLLEIYEYESGKVQLVPEAVNLHEMVQECLDTASLLSETGPVSLVNAIPKDFPPLHLDRFQAKRVFMNLLANAMAHAPETTQVDISVALETEDAVELCMADDGPGISKDFLPHLFERYFVVKQTRKKVGTGLGLSITKMIMELHGGSIRAESEHGLGTRFFLGFPKGKHSKISEA